VEDVEIYSSSKAVSCADGAAHTSAVVIMAGGVRPQKLGVPGEDRLQGKGIIHCALCDAGLYAERKVAVLGGSDVALIEAMYLADRDAKVTVIEAGSEPSARADLRERAAAHPNMEIRLGENAVQIKGEDGVTGLVVEKAGSGEKETLDAYGVLIRTGFEPETDCLEAVLSLDDEGYAEEGEDLGTEVPGLILAGDIRLGSPRDVATAVSDGKRAAEAAMKILGAAS
jgi:thioredoxin reductase (NADPH)